MHVLCVCDLMTARTEGFSLYIQDAIRMIYGLLEIRVRDGYLEEIKEDNLNCVLIDYYGCI